MKVLVVAPNYPCPGYRFSGIFNQRCAYALRELCDRVEVLAPRPYVPPLLSSLEPRWKAYATAARYEIQEGIPICRPTTPVIPRVAQAFWADQGTFWRCRQIARKMHARTHFNAIISFDLGGAGGVAWRIGRDLNIPACGWATGGDIRVLASSAHGRVVIRALNNLDMVFYQSHELLERAADLLGIFPRQLSPDRHIVLPRGIPEPPTLAKTQIRDRIRAKLEIKTHEVVILYIGRISRQKGLLELLEALNLATFRDLKLRGVLVGSQPGFDETALIEKKLHEIPKLNERVMLLPACNPDEVWEYLCAADIFAFPSHKEGMPNSLLEAMAMGVPTIAFAIPPIVEVEAETGALTLVPPLDPARFAEAILRLVACPDERRWTGEKGRMVVKDRFMVRKNMAEALHRLELLVTERRGGANKQIAIL